MSLTFVLRQYLYGSPVILEVVAVERRYIKFVTQVVQIANYDL